MQFKSKNVDQTLSFAAVVAKHIPDGSIILLNGDLGAGKTTFVKGFAKEKGISEKITSPTFTILKTYNIDDDHLLVHVDAYRLENSSFDELDDFLVDENIVFIEWSNYLQNQELLNEHLAINIEYISKNQRKITLTAVGEKYKSILEKVKNHV